TQSDSPHVLPALRSKETFLLPDKGPYTALVANLYWNPVDYPEDPALVQGWILDKINREPELLSMQAIAGFDFFNRLIIIVPGAYRSSYRDGRATIEHIATLLRRIVGNAIELQLGVS